MVDKLLILSIQITIENYAYRQLNNRMSKDYLLDSGF